MRMSVLVRPKGSISGADRIAKLLEKPIFAEVVEAAGGVEAAAGRPGRGGRGRPGRRTRRCPATSTRSCTAPATCRSTRRSTRGSPPTSSASATCWTGSTRRRPSPAGTSTTCTSRRRTSRGGAAAASPRRRSSTTSTSRPSSRGASAQRQEVEYRSRGVDVLIKERKKAEKEHSRAGLLTAARATEAARKQWVKDELVRIGTERARSLGWTDCYTFTKAMGERVVERWAGRAGDPRRASIVRPSIIESALERPHVGWIEGFKMAEPLILAYGRGELPEFPAAAGHDRRHRPGRPRRLRDRRGAGAPAGARRRSATSTSPAATATR